jgi:hypothetical protein
MSQPNPNTDSTRESAEARAALERRAAELGVRPFDAEEWFTETEDQTPEDVTHEVDDFLRLVRDQRDAPSARSLD